MGIRCVLGHSYTIQTVGTSAVKMCTHCGKSFILAEKVNRLTGDQIEEYWKPMNVPTKKGK